MEQSTMPSQEEKNRETRQEICDAFKQMTLAHIKRLSNTAPPNPDEIRALRECVANSLNVLGVDFGYFFGRHICVSSLEE